MSLEEMAKFLVPTIENINALLYLILFVPKWRFSKKTVFWSCAAVILLLAPYNMWCTLKFGSSRYAVTHFSILPNAVFILLIFILGKMEHGRLLFSVSISYMLVFLCGTLSLPFESGSYYFQAFIRLVSFILLAYLSCRYQRPLLFSAMAWIEKGWYILSLFPLSLLPFYLLTYNRHAQNYIYYGLLVESILVYTILLWLFTLLRRQNDTEYERSLLDTNVSAMRQQCEQLQAVNDATRIIRHDIRHYCQLMKTAIAVDDRTQAVQILNKIEEKTSDAQLNAENVFSTSPEECNYSTQVNALLSYYKHTAQVQGINMRISLNMPQTPSFDMVEFCVLISNGVENAINACLKVPKADKRKIVVSGELKQEQFFFEIKNTYAEHIIFENQRPVSKKPGHGYGIQSICGFASKYNAILDFQADGTWFRLRLLV